MAKLSSKRGYEITRKGRTGFGAGMSLTFDKTLRLVADARDCLEFVGTALRDWYHEAHRTGQRFDAGQLPRDSTGWVGYDTGLLATRWRLTVEGNVRTARMSVWVQAPDRGRALRLATLTKEGIYLSGLSGKALDVYTRAFATYMADALVVE